MIKIALIQHSPNNDNLGVGALSVSELNIIRKICNERGVSASVVFLIGRDKRPAYVSGPDVGMRFIRPIRRPFDFFLEIRKFDLVIDIGGGDSFSDIYGVRRLGQMFLMKFLTHLANRPLVLAPQTYGPFKFRLSKFLALLTLRLSAIVSTRDKISTNFLRSLGFNGPILEASDVALKLPYEAAERTFEKHAVRVGINVSGLLFRGGYTKNNMFGLSLDYASLISELVSRFLKYSEDCEVHLIPHVVSSEGTTIEDDYSACLEIAKDFPDVKIAPSFSSPSEAKSYIAGMDFFMGARMHACIAAFSTGVPVVPMAYSRKFAGLFGSLGFDETVDCTALSLEEVILRIFDAFDRRSTISVSQNTALNVGISNLERYEAALGDFMVDLQAKL